MMDDLGRSHFPSAWTRRRQTQTERVQVILNVGIWLEDLTVQRVQENHRPDKCIGEPRFSNVASRHCPSARVI